MYKYHFTNTKYIIHLYFSFWPKIKKSKEEEVRKVFGRSGILIN